MSNKKIDTDLDREWENRVLCSDESCIGTIDADGRCRECGRTFEGVLPSGLQDVHVDGESAPTVEEETDTGDTDDAVDEGPGGEAQDADPDDAWARRILCIDEGCIGVVDEATGCCKECGKPYPED